MSLPSGAEGLVNPLVELGDRCVPSIRTERLLDTAYVADAAVGVDVPSEQVDGLRGGMAGLFAVALTGVGDGEQGSSQGSFAGVGSFLQPQGQAQMAAGAVPVLQPRVAIPDLLVDLCLIEPVRPGRVAGLRCGIT